MPVYKIEQLKSKEIIPGFTARMTWLNDLLFSHWKIEKGSRLPEHHHHHEQISILVEGQFEFELDGEKHIINPGMVVMIPSNAVHSGLALTDCVIIDLFSPVRTDYIDQMNAVK